MASRELLLEIVLGLATDPWPQVAQPARAWLAQEAPDQAPGGGGPPQPRDAVLGMVARLLQGLLPALQNGEDVGVMHARQLAAALQVPPSCTSNILDAAIIVPLSSAYRRGHHESYMRLLWECW